MAMNQEEEDETDYRPPLSVTALIKVMAILFVVVIYTVIFLKILFLR
jgi:hypothetical protein